MFLVGPPGVGKTQALSPMEFILRKAGSVTLAPNDVTKQGLLDCLALAERGVLINERPFNYHFLALHIRELTNFMTQYDKDLTGLLTDLFDCPHLNEEHKRGHDKGKALVNPGLSFIMGTATQQLGHTISDDLWGSGFMARVIMVYSAQEVIPLDMFSAEGIDEGTRDELITAFTRLGELRGPMEWTPPARAMLRDFRVNQKDGAPLHNRLTSYVTRRWLHLGKLCMVSALADERMTVDADDFLLALGWLLSAEADMPEIFKDMQSHEDGQVHEELRSAMFGLHMQGVPITSALIYKWLSKRVASHSVERVFAVAIAADYFKRIAGEDDLYIPQSPTGTKDRSIL